MAYRHYLCVESHFDGRLFKQGLLYSFPSDPGGKFTLLEKDPVADEKLGLARDLDGTIYIVGGFYGYDDFTFPMTQAKQGANDLPAYDYTAMGIAFPQNDSTEQVYMSSVCSHRMKSAEGLWWFPHLHYFQDEPEIPVFEYRYRLCLPGEAVPSWSAWIQLDGTQEFTYTSGTIHQIMEFPEIIVGDIGVAAIADIQLRRNDNVVTGDVVVKAFDFHVPFDAPLGSGQEYFK